MGSMIDSLSIPSKAEPARPLNMNANEVIANRALGNFGASQGIVR